MNFWFSFNSLHRQRSFRSFFFLNSSPSNLLWIAMKARAAWRAAFLLKKRAQSQGRKKSTQRRKIAIILIVPAWIPFWAQSVEIPRLRYLNRVISRDRYRGQGSRDLNRVSSTGYSGWDYYKIIVASSSSCKVSWPGHPSSPRLPRICLNIHLDVLGLFRPVTYYEALFCYSHAIVCSLAKF